MSAINSTDIAVARAVEFLTRPLGSPTYTETTILSLQRILEANLTAALTPSPLAKVANLTLNLSATFPPPAIHAACIATGIMWSSWINLLSGGRSFDLIISSDSVDVKFNGQIYTMWSRPLTTLSIIRAATLKRTSEHNDKSFPIPIHRPVSSSASILRPSSPIPRPPSSASSFDSSSESGSGSGSDSGFSYTSSQSSASSYQSAPSLKYTPPHRKISAEVPTYRRDRALRTRVFVDTTKTEVTPYNGGKTTVLTGGVMLGGRVPTITTTVPKSTNTSWRRAATRA